LLTIHRNGPRGFPVDLIDRVIHHVGNLRDTLPEPFDYADHSGNLASSLGVTSFSTIIAGFLIAGLHATSKEPLTLKKVAAIAGVGATLGIVANVGTEIEPFASSPPVKTLLNLHKPEEPPSPDPIDAAYGIPTSLGASVFMARGLRYRSDDSDLDLGREIR
jgi:hypothetical protein